jgi:hypothetical protein
MVRACRVRGAGSGLVVVEPIGFRRGGIGPRLLGFRSAKCVLVHLGVCAAKPAWQSKGYDARPWSSDPHARVLSSREENVVSGGVVDGLGGHVVELLEQRFVWPIGCDDGSCSARLV